MSTNETVSFYRKNLPHWEVRDGRYFITIRVRGSLPYMVIQRLYALHHHMSDSPENDGNLRRTYFVSLEKALDDHTEIDYLIRPDIAGIVTSALNYYHEAGKWKMYSYVLMPNHLHLFFQPVNLSYRQCIKDFKAWTTKQIHIHAPDILHDTSFWQDEYFDHWSRLDSEDQKIIRYIHNNPVKAGLVESYIQWPYIK